MSTKTQTPKPSASTGPKTRTLASAKPSTAKRRKTDAPAPKPVRKHAPRYQGYQEHLYERKVDGKTGKPCLACGIPFVHAKGFCSVCYNVSRKLAKEGLSGKALVNRILVKRGMTVTPPTVRKPRTKKVVTPPAAAVVPAEQPQEVAA